MVGFGLWKKGRNGGAGLTLGGTEALASRRRRGADLEATEVKIAEAEQLLGFRVAVEIGGGTVAEKGIAL
jgi:hypothetical protein